MQPETAKQPIRALIETRHVGFYFNPYVFAIGAALDWDTQLVVHFHLGGFALYINF
jgi:hypothetical protein